MNDGNGKKRDEYKSTQLNRMQFTSRPHENMRNRLFMIIIVIKIYEKRQDERNEKCIYDDDDDGGQNYDI